MSFTSIPILDLSMARNLETKPEFLKELRHALMEVGFLYLKNIGIPDELFQRVIFQGKSFFNIPEEEKYVATCAQNMCLLHNCFLEATDHRRLTPRFHSGSRSR